ncbi:MAG: hypothetical protein ACTSYC_05160 [Promethearchaeota archaeon]
MNYILLDYSWMTMLTQGLFNILDLYLDNIDLFYASLDDYFWKEFKIFFGERYLETKNFFKDKLKQLNNNSSKNLNESTQNLNSHEIESVKENPHFNEILTIVFDKEHQTPSDLRREIRQLKRENKIEEWKRKKEEWKVKKEKLHELRKLNHKMKKKKNSQYMTEILNEIEKAFLDFLKKEFVSLEFKEEYIETRFMDPFLKIRKEENNTISSPIVLYKKKIAPILYEIFLEKVLTYLADLNATSVLLNLKARGYLPIEFTMELIELKELMEKSEKTENLKKYIHIRDRIIQKFQENKEKIEKLEKLEDPVDKLQLNYLIFRIINFFNLEYLFNFSSLKEYLKNNLDEWLISIPLISLKNPDIYFCGIYLAKQLGIKIDEVRVKSFLEELYEETIDEFEAPIIEATDRVYYFLKSTSLIKWHLSEEQLLRLVQAESKFFKSPYLKDLETSQLVVILKIYRFLGIFDKINPQNIKAIVEEIKLRVTPEGIRQRRDEIVASEATYYVLFCNYMQNALEDLKSVKFIDTIISRIYRNLEIVDFSETVNYDLISEIFYSLESLKLFNCIETKEMILHLAQALFPKEVVNKIRQREKIGRSSAKFRHFKVDRITGETIY